RDAEPARRAGSVLRPCGCHSASGASLLLALPDLLATDEGDAAGYAQAIVVDHLRLGAIGLALGGVEDGAARPGVVTVGAQSPQDGHALDRLVLVGAGALVAGGVRA